MSDDLRVRVAKLIADAEEPWEDAADRAIAIVWNEAIEAAADMADQEWFNAHDDDDREAALSSLPMMLRALRKPEEGG